MFKIAGVVLLILALIGISNKLSYDLGVSDESVRTTKSAVELAKKVSLETLRLQKANDIIADKFFESSVNSYEKESNLTAELKQLHDERLSDAPACGISNEPDDNIIARLRVINKASDSSALPNSNNPAVVIKEAYEIDSYTLSVIFDRNRIAEQLNSLIEVVE